MEGIKLIADFIDFLRATFFGCPGPKRIELRRCGYAEADQLLRSNTGWRLAIPEEDNNRAIGIVFLERVEFDKGIPKVAERVEAREIFWTIKDPAGRLIHTMISVDAAGSISEFLQTEQAVNQVVRLAGPGAALCTQSWEMFEAEGYSCVPVFLIEAGKKDLTPENERSNRAIA